MSAKRDQIPVLQVAIQQRHKCSATHRDTIYVEEEFQGKTLWKGDVEVFELEDHPKATHCYAWLHHEGGEAFRQITFLNVWPVTSPVSAVKAAIALDIMAKPSGGQPSI